MLGQVESRYPGLRGPGLSWKSIAASGLLFSHRTFARAEPAFLPAAFDFRGFEAVAVPSWCGAAVLDALGTRFLLFFLRLTFFTTVIPSNTSVV
jgi:hypothetical protein